MKLFLDPSVFTEKRGALMGLSIIWIFMLHCGDIGVGWYDGIRKYGWVGVDVFFFLSAIGLCFSFQKRPSIKTFYCRRLLRIVPTWLVVLLGVHIIGLLCNRFLPALPFHVPHTFTQCLTWYTGLGYWIGEFVSNPENYYYEWYVPSLLVFYAAFPLLFKQKTKILFALTVLFTILSHFLSTNHILYTWHFFYQRIPVFMFGIISFRIIKGEEMIRKLGVYGYCFMFMFGLLLLHLQGLLHIDMVLTHIIQLMMPVSLIVLGRILSLLRLAPFFAFYGGISLELYLIHLYRRPLFLLSMFLNNVPLCVFLSLILCTAVAFLLQKVMGIMVKKISVRFNFQ